jgi:hypothetical protein
VDNLSADRAVSDVLIADARLISLQPSCKAPRPARACPGPILSENRGPAGLNPFTAGRWGAESAGAGPLKWGGAPRRILRTVLFAHGPTPGRTTSRRPPWSAPRSPNPSKR